MVEEILCWWIPQPVGILVLYWTWFETPNRLYHLIALLIFNRWLFIQLELRCFLHYVHTCWNSYLTILPLVVPIWWTDQSSSVQESTFRHYLIRCSIIILGLVKYGCACNVSRLVRIKRFLTNYGREGWFKIATLSKVIEIHLAILIPLLDELNVCLRDGWYRLHVLFGYSFILALLKCVNLIRFGERSALILAIVRVEFLLNII